MGSKDPTPKIDAMRQQREEQWKRRQQEASNPKTADITDREATPKAETIAPTEPPSTPVPKPSSAKPKKSVAASKPPSKKESSSAPPSSGEAATTRGKKRKPPELL